MGRNAKYRAIVPAILAFLILVFFNRMAFSNLILARGDTFLYFYPYWQAAADALREGRLPFWNPDIFMGAPFLANSQTGFFYPFNWPFWLLLPTPYAVSASILTHLLIAGIGAYLAGRRTLGLGRMAALFAATLFALGGYLTAQVEHINQLQGLAWLPWLFAALAPVVAPGAVRTWRGLTPVVLSVGVVFSLQLLAGHTQTVFISGVAVALWLAVHLLQGWFLHRRPDRYDLLKGSVVVLFAGVSLAVILSAVQLLPTLELTGQSSRQGGLPINEVLSFSWNPVHLTRALLPGLGQSLFTEYVAFFPLTALGLVVVGAWGWRKNPAVLPWLALVLLAVILALGGFTPIYHLLGRLPGFNLFRAPVRWLAVAVLGAALLAGYGWQRLRLYAGSEWPENAGRDKARRDLVRPLIAAAIGLAILIAWGYVAGWAAQVIPVGVEAPFERPTPLSLLGWSIEFVLAALLLWVILTGPITRARQATLELLLLTVAVMWLGSRQLPYNQLTTQEAYFDLRSPQARLLALGTCAVPDTTCESPPGRFLSLSDIFFDPGDMAEIESIYADQLDPDAIYDYVIAIKNKEVLSPNLSMVTGTPAVDGFDGGILPLRAYSELMSLILPEGSSTTDGRLREYLTAVPDARWLSLFNGRYLITDKTGDSWREGVYFDQQHPVQIDHEAVAVADLPSFEATELWLIADGTPPVAEITTSEGDVWRLTAELLDEPDLFRYVFPQPATAEALSLLPCVNEPAGCGAHGLTLVDSRDNSFQPLTFAPYRLIYSGDVKIYENLEAHQRAFVVYDWARAADMNETIDIMRSPDFDPAASAVVVGGGEAVLPPSRGRGMVGITEYSPERIALRVNSDRDGLLVLSDAYYPGWRATIDGETVAVRRVNGLFRGVFLPPGEHEVVFFYESRSFQMGAAVTIFGLLLILGILTFVLIGSRRAIRHEHV